MRGGSNLSTFQSVEKALKFLRGNDYNIENEFEELKNVVENEKKRSEEKSRLSLLRSRTFLQPALLISISFTIRVTSGIELCTYYVGFIFKDVGISLEIAGIIMQGTITVGYLLTPLLQSRFDCRDINAVFMLGTAVSMLMMGLSFTFPSLSMAMLPCLVVSSFFYGIGVGPTCYILMSTLFTQHMKTTGMVTGQVVRALVNTVQLKVQTNYDQ